MQQTSTRTLLGRIWFSWWMGGLNKMARCITFRPAITSYHKKKVIKFIQWYSNQNGESLQWHREVVTRMAKCLEHYPKDAHVNDWFNHLSDKAKLRYFLSKKRRIE